MPKIQIEKEGSKVKNNNEEYENFILTHRKGHFLQSPEWAKLKSEWKNEVVLSEDKDGNIKGAMSILIRKVPYINSCIVVISLMTNSI